MIEDETFDSIDDALDITDRGAEIMKHLSINLQTCQESKIR